MRQVKCVDAAQASCGEGLLWDAARDLVWWVDIPAQRLHSYAPTRGTSAALDLPCPISALAPGEDGEMLVATEQGIGTVDVDSGAISIRANPEPNTPKNRLNDMVAGPDGCLWAGTMREGGDMATGALYRYGPDGVTPMMTGTIISNGIDWSPDGARLYFVDTIPGRLHVWEDGAWSVLRSFDDVTGKPDGLTVDALGRLWIAMAGGSCVLGVSPAGTIVETIRMPCEMVTNCTFGGHDLKSLFVTTATYTMTDAERQANPLAGGLFEIEMDTPGRLPFAARWPANKTPA